MVAVPAFLAVTTPEALTVATAVLDEDQDTVLFEAFAGVTVAFNVVVLPTARVTLAGDTNTPVTGWVTVTVEVAVLAPSTVVTVITA